jgi:transposase
MWTERNRCRYSRDGLRYPSDLTDAEWAFVAAEIPPALPGGNKRTVDIREVVNPTESLNLHDGLLPHLSAARTPRQSVRQGSREADAQGCD